MAETVTIHGYVECRECGADCAVKTSKKGLAYTTCPEKCGQYFTRSKKASDALIERAGAATKKPKEKKDDEGKKPEREKDGWTDWD